jgi:hypothetical protein
MRGRAAMMRTLFQATPSFLRSFQMGPRRRSSRRLAIRPGERLERRELLASHPGFVYDANDALVPEVDPNCWTVRGPV